jgi:hypothetical protein
MDAFFGIVALLVVSLFVIVPAGFVLVAAFAYVRVQKGQPVDIGTGLSAYAVVLLGASALVLTLGVARLLTALMGEIAFDYTYGDANGDVVMFGLDGSSGATDLGTDDDRQSQDVATGLALVIGAGIAGTFHFWLRSFLKDRGTFDRGVEGAWDTLQALALGVVVLALVATVFDETLSRAIVTKEGSSPGDTVAAMFAFIGLWVVYGYRALGHLGVRFGRPQTSGGVPL